MQPLYQHTQVGYISIVGIAIVVIVAVLMRRRKGSSGMDESLDGPSRSRGMTVVLLLAALIMTMLISMTIRVDSNTVSWSMGPGLIRGSVAVTDIADTRPVTTGTGWGLRHSEAGWLYNVSGTHAVELDLRDGQHIRLGSDEPAQLAGAIRAAMNK